MKYLKSFVKFIIGLGALVLVIFTIINFIQAGSNFAEAAKAKFDDVKDSLEKAGYSLLMSGFMCLIGALTNIGVVIYLFQVDCNEEQINKLWSRVNKNAEVVKGFIKKADQEKASDASNSEDDESTSSKEEQVEETYAEKCSKNVPSREPTNFLEYVLYSLVKSGHGLTAKELITMEPDLITEGKLFNTEKNGLIVNKEGRYYLTDKGFSYIKRTE